MKLYSMQQEATKDPDLLAEFENAREFGTVRAGERTFFFKVRLRTYYIPYTDIRRCFRRVFLIPAGAGKGKSELELENLVICGEEGELAQIQIPGSRMAKELIKELKERIPHADFSSPAKKAPRTAEDGQEAQN